MAVGLTERWHIRDTREVTVDSQQNARRFQRLESANLMAVLVCCSPLPFTHDTPPASAIRQVFDRRVEEFLCQQLDRTAELEAFELEFAAVDDGGPQQ